MQSIRIDNDVMNEIEKRAMTLGLGMFNTTPNSALRAIFELGDDESVSSVKSPRRRSASARVLLREHQSIRAIKTAKGAYYQREGRSFSKPRDEQYPVVFFDPNGYVVIKSAADLKGPEFSVSKAVYVPDGISSLKNYKECGHLHTR